MKIANGTVVKFWQSFSSVPHGSWGRLEREIIFPGELSLAVANELRDKEVGFTTSIKITHFKNTEYSNALVFKIPRSQLIDPGLPLKEGMTFRTKQNHSNQVFTGVIKDVQNASHITLDCNPPFIGEEVVNCSVKVLEVRQLPEEEKALFQPSARAF